MIEATQREKKFYYREKKENRKNIRIWSKDVD